MFFFKLAFIFDGIQHYEYPDAFQALTGKLKARGGEVRWRTKSVKHMLSNH